MANLHPDLARIFELFKDDDVAIIGSTVSNPNSGRDIDVLVPYNEAKWSDLVKRFGVKYSGWDTPRGHVRRANLTIPGISRQVQLTCNSKAPTIRSHPHETLLRDGTILNEGRRFRKPRGY